VEREGLEKMHLLPLPPLQFKAAMDTTRGRGRSPELAKTSVVHVHGAGVKHAVKNSKDSNTPITKATMSVLMKYGFEPALPDALERCDDDIFYLFLQKQNLGAKLHIYLKEGTYPKRLFRGRFLMHWNGVCLSVCVSVSVTNKQTHRQRHVSLCHSYISVCVYLCECNRHTHRQKHVSMCP